MIDFKKNSEIKQKNGINEYILYIQYYVLILIY